MQVPVYNTGGEVVRHIDVSERVFAVPFNEAVVHQALVRQRANARQGTADTKTRGEVSGSGRKIYRQKHTGMARAGNRQSPLRRGGGIVFGPHPRSYRQAMPKKMRRLALCCVISAKVSGGEMKVLEQFGFAGPETKRMAEVLAALGVDSTALIVTAGPEANVIKSARNIPGVKTMPASLLNVVDILSYKVILVTEAAVRKAEELWGEKTTGGDGRESV